MNKHLTPVALEAIGTAKAARRLANMAADNFGDLAMDRSVAGDLRDKLQAAQEACEAFDAALIQGLNALRELGGVL